MMSNTNDAARKTARAKYAAARRRMATAIATRAGATLDAEATLDGHGNIVVGGAPAELEKVRAHMHALGVQCEIEPPFADDPDWTCARIPEASITRALRAAERAVRS